MILIRVILFYGETDMFGYILISIFGKVIARVNEDKKYVKELVLMDKDEISNLFSYKMQDYKESDKVLI